MPRPDLRHHFRATAKEGGSTGNAGAVSGESRNPVPPTRFADLVDCVADTCLPFTAETEVYVGLEHIDSGAFQLNRFGHPDNVTSAKTRFQGGDILYGKLRPYLDKAILVDRGGICSTDILVLRPKPNVVAAYVLGLVHSEAFRDQATATTRGVNHPRTSWNGVSSFECLPPPKPEQEKIAAVLWKVQRAIATQDKLIAAIRDLKQSAMQHLFTHGLRGEPLKETEIGPMPESWNIAPLSKIARLERGRFMHRPRNEPRFYGGDMPFVQTGDVVRSQGHITKYTQTLNTEGIAISRVFPKGTILITIAANIGFVGILDFDSACPDSLVAISPSATTDTEFLLYFLQLQQPIMNRLAPKGTQKNINIQFLDPWPIAVPDLNEQRDIAAALAAIDRKLAHHHKKRAALNGLFQTLLHKLMTAEIRVTDLDIDTSELEA
ncbi:MAG: restriction endonuclease subunit S [Gammaproteobacteria bacterium]